MSTRWFAAWWAWVALALVLVWLPFLALGDDAIVHRLTFDDAWYYFTIARNLADGAGSTFDGMNVTNGYHPLWMLVCAIPYGLGFDDLDAVRLLLVLQLLLWAAAVGIIGASLERLPGAPGAAVLDGDVHGRRRRLFTAIGWAALVLNPFTVKLFVNGLESGLAALLMAVLLRRSLSGGGCPIGSPVVGGILLGTLFLSRTDLVFICGAALLWAAVLDGRLTRRVLVAGVVTAAIGAAYLVSNVALVGHPMQISGVTKRVPLTAGGALQIAGCLVVAASALVAARRLARSDEHRLPRTAAWFVRTAWFLAGSLGILAYNWGLASEIFLWHYGPIILWMLVTVTVALGDLVEGAGLEAAGSRSPGRQAASVGAIVVLPLLALVWYATRSFVGPDLPAVQERAHLTAGWMNANLPDDAVVGSFDAGVLGYFSDRPVVNLDGLVNSFDWREARKEGTAATSAFLAETGMTHLSNQGDPREGDDAGLRQVADALIGDGAGEALELVHREDFVFSTGQPYTFYVFALGDWAPLPSIP